jgi:uncharacterized protein YndB with AHSA1/START domain
MKTLLIVVGAVVALVVLLIVVMLVIGARLNPNHVAARSIRLQRSPDDVYAVVRDFGQHPKWRSDVKSVELLGTVAGKFQFREHGSNGIVTYEVLDDVAGRRLVTRIVDQDLGYTGSWNYEFSPADGGTVLTITETGEVTNAFFRFMSRYVFGHTATIDAYLKSLAQHFGETALPQDAAK